MVDARVLFNPQLSSENELSLLLTAAAFGEQAVEVFLNDLSLGEVFFSEQRSQFKLPLRATTLRPGQLNHLRFHIPDAKNPSLEELRTLGLRFAPHRLGLRNVSIQIVDSTME